MQGWRLTTEEIKEFELGAADLAGVTGMERITKMSYDSSNYEIPIENLEMRKCWIGYSIDCSSNWEIKQNGRGKNWRRPLCRSIQSKIEESPQGN